jgi:GT2 family glycosyltransferase
MAEVWVVDNGSGDCSREMVRESFPWVTLVEADTNLGFGAAVNLVAARTESEWIAPSNADVELEPDALRRLLETGESDARTGAVAPQLVLPDGSTQHSVFPFPSVALALLTHAGLDRLSPRTAERLCLTGRWDPTRPRAVPWAIGAFLIVRRAAFDRVGGFDPRQWMYAEDLDLGWRLHEGGWFTRYEPRAVVRHAESAAIAQAFGAEKTARWMAATYQWVTRRRGIVHAWAIASISMAGMAARAACFSVLSRISPRRWSGSRDRATFWVRVHRQGLRSRRRLLAHR